MKRENVLFVFIIMTLLLCLLVGCSNRGITTDFSYRSDGCDDMPTMFLDYKTITNKLDLNNVVLEVSFGWVDVMKYDTQNYDMHIELLAYNIKAKDEIIILNEISKFNTDDYVCRLVKLNKWSKKSQIEYNHSEQVLIPEILFDGQEGSICIALRSDSTEFGTLGNSQRLYYSRIGDNLIKVSSHQ